MRDQGRLVEWFDDKGYGFIQPNRSEKARVFLHIKDFARPGPRPILGCALEYVVQRDSKGRFRAQQVSYLKASQIKSTQKVLEQPKKRHPLDLLSITYIVVLAIFSIVGVLSGGILLALMLINVVTYWLYAQDKTAATENRSRTPENTLHLMACLGGWPAAHLAQKKLRHKTQKQPFRRIYLCSIGLNILLIIVLISPISPF